MGLFDEKEKAIKEKYVNVLDVLEKLYEKSDQGWYEVLHFIKNSSIDSITTYLYSDSILHDVIICDEVLIEKLYEEGSSLCRLKDALCAFLSNNCDSLDGEHLENKIIAESELSKQFKKYVWLKNDIKCLDEFKTLNLIELIERGRPLKNNKKAAGMIDAMHQEDKKYIEFIFCIEHFAERFNRPIIDIAKFLKHTKFYKHCNVYIRIGCGEFIDINKINSEKSLLFVLDFLDDKKFNKMDLGLNFDYLHLNHILINEDDLLYFKPLEDLRVDIKMGHTIYENIRYGNIKSNTLDTFEKYHFQVTENFFNTYWERLKNTEYEQEDPIIEPCQTNSAIHPSLDPSNSNHAPELLLAIKVWEAKYLENEYPHHEHTPAITNILRNKNVTQVNLVKRICAITNPKK